MKTEPQTTGSSFKNFFIHPSENRLRLFWRLLVFGILLGGTVICASTIILPFLLLTNTPLDVNNRTLNLISSLVSLISVTVSVFLVRRFIDRRPIMSLGLKLDRQMMMDLLVGFAITFFQFLLIYGINLLAGWAEFIEFAWQSAPAPYVIQFVLTGLLMFISVGWTEELVARGYLLQNLEEGTNLFWALLISSVLFSLGHFLNPNRTWVALVGLVLAGLFLAYAYLRTRQLWLAIGLHIGWNFFEGNVFGYPVSGMDSYGLVRQRITGPELWTGGDFGPEAGLILIPGLLLGVLLIWLYTRNRDSDQLLPTTPQIEKE